MLHVVGELSDSRPNIVCMNRYSTVYIYIYINYYIYSYMQYIFIFSRFLGFCILYSMMVGLGGDLLCTIMYYIYLKRRIIR